MSYFSLSIHKFYVKWSFFWLFGWYSVYHKSIKTTQHCLLLCKWAKRTISAGDQIMNFPTVPIIQNWRVFIMEWHLLAEIYVTQSVRACGTMGCRNLSVRVQPSVSGHGDVTLVSYRLNSGLHAWRLGSHGCSTSGGPVDDITQTHMLVLLCYKCSQWLHSFYSKAQNNPCMQELIQTDIWWD